MTAALIVNVVFFACTHFNFPGDKKSGQDQALLPGPGLLRSPGDYVPRTTSVSREIADHIVSFVLQFLLSITFPGDRNAILLGIQLAVLD